MKCTTKKLRSPLKWHGGKSYLARRIINLFPPHKVYVEPYIGGGSILLNKAPAEREIAGDTNTGLINLWTCLQDPLRAVAILAGELPYDEATFHSAKQWAMSSNSGSAAVGFLVRNRFSRGGLGKDFAWSDRLRGGQPGDVNAWQTIKAELPAIAERVKGVEFGVSDGWRLIKAVDDRDALFYCDPPYLHETRTHKTSYQHEMSNDQHRTLLETLLACRGRVVLSGYRSALYDKMLADWRRRAVRLRPRRFPRRPCESMESRSTSPQN